MASKSIRSPNDLGTSSMCLNNHSNVPLISTTITNINAGCNFSANTNPNKVINETSNQHDEISDNEMEPDSEHLSHEHQTEIRHAFSMHGNDESRANIAIKHPLSDIRHVKR